MLFGKDGNKMDFFASHLLFFSVSWHLQQGEPLNETETTHSYAGQFGGQHTGPGLVIRGIHRLTLDEPSSAAKVWRSLADRTYSQPQMLFRFFPPTAAINTASFATALPPNVQVMTLQALSTTTLLVRLSHQFGIGEDAQLSLPVTVDLAKTFAPSTFKVVSVQEVSLTNTQSKKELLQRRASNMEWDTEVVAAKSHSWREDSISGNHTATTVTLGPLEIKTFVITIA